MFKSLIKHTGEAAGLSVSEEPAGLSASDWRSQRPKGEEPPVRR